MRGKADNFALQPHDIGITPAYAGKRANIISIAASIKDHPRLCGEKTDLTILMLNKLGSPPPMRGKGPPAKVQQFCAGITPAYAGKSTNTTDTVILY